MDYLLMIQSSQDLASRMRHGLWAYDIEVMFYCVQYPNATYSLAITPLYLLLRTYRWLTCMRVIHRDMSSP
jgi:hypothetical protein